MDQKLRHTYHMWGMLMPVYSAPQLLRFGSTRICAVQSVEAPPHAGVPLSRIHHTCHVVLTYFVNMHAGTPRSTHLASAHTHRAPSRRPPPRASPRG